MIVAKDKARRALRLAHRAAFVTLLVSVFSGWGLVTGEQLIHPWFGVLGLVAGVTAGAAYRSAGRWEELAHEEMMALRSYRNKETP